jgi:hypothetical protein
MDKHSEKRLYNPSFQRPMEYLKFGPYKDLDTPEQAVGTYPFNPATGAQLRTTSSCRWIVLGQTGGDAGIIFKLFHSQYLSTKSAKKLAGVPRTGWRAGGLTTIG